MNILLPAMLLVLLATDPTTAGEQDFTLVNRTGVEIYELYIRPATTEDWQEDVLSADTLPDGEEIEIDFDLGEEADHWNIRVVDGEGDAIDWPEVDLTEISKIVLTFENGLPVARCE